ncbi:TIGR03086 family protein [Iamia sp. SCSIO 61187]|uniref:TIGR03086 family metal-binding protein n=1 Tax=Iamia sp. SCSIO 61187 TaxID=2722752 RepID=UPI001C62D660|nr:TIGR03086 family metal-binding protein [Iamia sp. SCSIO 61187]QYG91221.1 TIGR03086 family protein [Iamia sp. SCSIO 61187]
MAPSPRPADHRPAHRLAVELATPYIDMVTDADLTRPTPCAGWDLAVLLTHMVGQHRGFAASVTDGDAPLTAFVPAAFSPATWRASVDALVAAFAAAELDATVIQPEMVPEVPLPVGLLVGAQMLDTVVHTWDVARSLGLDFTPPDDLADAVATVLPLIPDDDGRLAPGAPFGPALTAGVGTWDHILAWLGRDPAWSPADAAA